MKEESFISISRKKNHLEKYENNPFFLKKKSERGGMMLMNESD